MSARSTPTSTGFSPVTRGSCPVRKKLDEVSFDEMLELSASGAGVLMTRSVEVGRRYNIPIHVRSSFHRGSGTWVKEATLEQAIIRGIAHDRSEAKVTVRGVPDQPGVAAALFEPLAERGVNVDMIVQNVGHDGLTDISFTVPKESASNAAEVAGKVADELGAAGVDDRRERRQGVPGWSRDEVASGRCRRRLPGPVGCGHQYRDDLDVHHSHLVHRAGQPGRRRRQGPSRGLRPSHGQRGGGSMSDRRVAVVGATGAVGRTMIEVLSQRDFPLAELRLLASARSAGSIVGTPWGDIKVENLEDADPSGIDIAFSRPGPIAREPSRRPS